MWRPASHNPLGGEAQPDMVRGPHAIGIAQRRPQQLDDLGKDPLPLRLLELLEEGAAEGFEPAFMPISSGVGRGTSMIDLTAKPPCSSRRLYSATDGKNQGATLSGSPPWRAPTARIAVAMAATLP